MTSVPTTVNNNNSMDLKRSVPDVDPFSHNLVLTWPQWLRGALFTVFVLPFRFLFVILSVIGSWAVCKVALWTMTEHEKTQMPMTGWRKLSHKAASFFGRSAFFFTGFQSVTVKGRRAPASEAPILVVAPHSTFFDAFAIFWSDAPYIVSRAENKKIPFIGPCTECAQALFVSREDPRSRQKTVQEIIRRCASGDPWPQLMIFPEGSCSNRKALMTFKPGAFYPGKPVQPVILRYPNRLDTVTWTWNQPYGAYKVMWLTMTQPHLKAELEYLPVYHPSGEEIADPKLFARNVRDVMADALGVPISDQTYEEAKALYGKKRTRSRSRSSSRKRQ